MRVIAYSNKGPVRERNEDALFAAGSVISGCSMAEPVVLDVEAGARGGCFAVIDGMGGYKGGERAANLVALSLMEGRWSGLTARACREELERALDRAARHMEDDVLADAELSAMGAALAGIVFCVDAVLAFNCGDCRAYRRQGTYLERLTHDHSVVQELCDLGEIDEEAMRTHPRKNTITSCVCVNLQDKLRDIYFREIPCAWDHTQDGGQRGPGSGRDLFICSDGVWEALPIDKLEECLAGRPACEGADVLVRTLLGLGGGCRDNVSFLLFDTE